MTSLLRSLVRQSVIIGTGLADYDHWLGNNVIIGTGRAEYDHWLGNL